MKGLTITYYLVLDYRFLVNCFKAWPWRIATQGMAEIFLKRGEKVKEWAVWQQYLFGQQSMLPIVVSMTFSLVPSFFKHLMSFLVELCLCQMSCLVSPHLSIFLQADTQFNRSVMLLHIHCIAHKSSGRSESPFLTKISGCCFAYS